MSQSEAAETQDDVELEIRKVIINWPGGNNNYNNNILDRNTYLGKYIC